MLRSERLPITLPAMARLTRDFFARETLIVARNLLGCRLVHIVDGRRVSGRLVEVEAYTGSDDAASHASRGRTPRNAVMFGPPGVSYVYFTYGIHWLLNVIAKPPDVDYGAAVLLRALEPLEGLELMAARRIGRPRREWANGPAKLTKALGIDGAHNRVDMTAPDGSLFFEWDDPVPDGLVLTGPRVGIDSVPEPWKSKPWRFWVAGSPHVSRSR